MRRLVLSALLAFAPTAALADVIIDGATPGYYNDAIGDLGANPSFNGQTDAATLNSLFPIANSAGGDPLTPPVATEPDLSFDTEFDTFLSNAAPTGGGWSAGPVAIPSSWAVNTETAIVYEFDAGPTGLDNFIVNIGVDNGVYVWLDGVYLLGAMAPGGAFAFEYSTTPTNLSAGTHYLQILLEDHGGGTGYVIEATADKAAAISEPGLIGLLGLAFIGLSVARRRA
ncbi:MAG: VPLPA-CTERM sorting domain-containing protein [Pseudomonadota bacterium]